MEKKIGTETDDISVFERFSNFSFRFLLLDNTISRYFTDVLIARKTKIVIIDVVMSTFVSCKKWISKSSNVEY